MEYKGTHIAVIGSRDWEEHKSIIALVNILLSDEDVTLHTGCCPTGVDKFVREGWGSIVHEADWDTHGRAAGPIRNHELVMECDMVFVFQKNKSRGSQNIIELCKKHNTPCFVMEV